MASQLAWSHFVPRVEPLADEHITDAVTQEPHVDSTEFSLAAGPTLQQRLEALRSTAQGSQGSGKGS